MKPGPMVILFCILFITSVCAQDEKKYKKNFLGVYGGVSIASGGYTKNPDFFTTGYQFSIGYRRSPGRFFSYKLLLRHIGTPRNRSKVEDYYGFKSVTSYISERLNRYEFHAGPVLSIPYKNWSFDFRLDGAVLYAMYPNLQISGIADTLNSVNISSDSKITFGYSADFWLRNNFKGNFSFGFGLDYSSVSVNFDSIEKKFEGGNSTITYSEKRKMHINSLSVLASLGFRF